MSRRLPLLVVLVLVVPAVVIGCFAAWVTRRVPRANPASPQAAKPAARFVERQVQRDTALGRLVDRRLDPAEATGLLLTLAVVVLVVGAAVLGVLLYMVGSDIGLVRFDRNIDIWASDHGTGFSAALLDVVTELGGSGVLIGVGALAFVVDFVRRSRPSLATPLFLALVIAGQPLITGAIKGAVDRVRPGAGLAAGLGPSFPSGHAAGAAATFAAVALVLGYSRTPRTQAWLAGAAVGIAIAVATSRVLLSVHWLTDAVAGLAVGWAWFSVCAIAFGGRLMRFGAPVEAGVRAEHLHAQATPDRHPHDQSDRQDDGRVSPVRG